MKCPICGHRITAVFDSRAVPGRDAVRRRRACMRCYARFTTYEIATVAFGKRAK